MFQSPTLEIGVGAVAKQNYRARIPPFKKVPHTLPIISHTPLEECRILILLYVGKVQRSCYKVPMELE